VEEGADTGGGHPVRSEISDPGHEWLEVSFKELADVGATINDFSDYSYLDVQNRMVYLEGDCDADRFLDRLPPQVFATLCLPTTTENKIRRLPRLDAIRAKVAKMR